MSAVTSYGRNMIYKVNDVIKTEFSNNDVVDCPACRRMGLDPEIEPKEGEPDLRPRTRTKAFAVYGDTDSVMVNFGDITLADCARLGALAAKLCTEKMEKPNSLAFETIKLRSLYLNKKRYAALEIEKIIPGEHMNDAIKRGKVSVKGLEGKRRDNALIGSDTQNAVIKILLKEGDVEKAENYVKQVISDLLQDKIDLSKLIISKGLSKTEEQYARGGAKLQHVELQKRMRARSKYTGEAVPETGDRVPYIVKADTATQTKSRQEKSSELSEDPIYAQKHGVPINTDYYIHKQIWPSVIRVFTGVHEPLKCLEISSNMPAKDRERLIAHQRLFSLNLPHMRHIVQRKPRSFGIASFTVALPKCLGCGVSIGPRAVDKACCANCSKQELVNKMKAEHEARILKSKEAWDVCRKCQGGGFGKVTCSNFNCEQFFYRERTLIDIEDLEKDLKKLCAASAASAAVGAVGGAF